MPRRNTTAPATPLEEGSTTGAWGLRQVVGLPPDCSESGLTGARKGFTDSSSPCQRTWPWIVPAVDGSNGPAASVGRPALAAGEGSASLHPAIRRAAPRARHRMIGWTRRPCMEFPVGAQHSTEVNLYPMRRDPGKSAFREDGVKRVDQSPDRAASSPQRGKRSCAMPS